MELSKSKFNLYCSLRSAKLRRKSGLFTVEGAKSIKDTFAMFEVVALIKTHGYELDFDAGEAPLYEVTADDMRKLTALSTPSQLIAVYRLPDNKLIDLKVPDGLYVALDGIQDPGNLGTIIRTCHWFGILRIFASKDTVDIYNPKCIQATMGSLASVRVDYCDLVELFSTNPDLPVYGTLLEGEDIFKARLGAHGFIVMGNEGNGLSREVRGLIDRPLFIPPANPDNHSESLNVAIATAIVISQFRSSHH